MIDSGPCSLEGRGSEDTLLVETYCWLPLDFIANKLESDLDIIFAEGVTGVTNNNQILETLQTKWRNLAIDWTDGSTPSIN